jgi:hypothetical protein
MHVPQGNLAKQKHWTMEDVDCTEVYQLVLRQLKVELKA